MTSLPALFNYAILINNINYKEIVPKMLNLPFKLIARIAERSEAFRNYIRDVHFKGKVVAVSHIDSRYLPKDDVLVEHRGIRYALNLQDAIQKFIYFNVYENRDISRILPLISAGSICLDVGANVGFYALHFAKRVGNNGKVYAIEASPKVVDRLRKNIALNSYENIIEVEALAVADKKGEIEFAISPDENSGWGHIGEDVRFSEKVLLKADTLDSFFESKKLTSVDLMKVDIEGAEDMLIAGAQKILRDGRIKHIFIEFCLMTCEEVKRRTETLRSFGYMPNKQDEEILEKMMKDNSFSRNRVQNFLFSCVKQL